MKRSFIVLFLSILCALTYAQSFTGKIEDTGEYYRLTYTVTSHDASRFTPPSLDDFEVLSGPNTSTFSSYQVVNGQMSHSETTSYVYILSAKKSGKITIGRATIRVGNKTLASNQITLNAQTGNSSNGGHRSPSGTSESHDLQKAGTRITQNDVFIDLTPSRTKVNEQEAVLLTYKVHTKLNVGLSQTQLANQPDFKGMISQEIGLPDNQIVTSLEHRNGVTYRTGTILQYVIFPQKSGQLKIPSLSFNLTILQQREPMSLADAFFNGGGNIGVQIKRVVPEMTLDVAALPQPKPANFSGAVGHFNIKGHLVNEVVKTNEIMTYRVEIEGAGNMKLVTAPKMTLPKDFDTYDVKTNEDFEITPQGFKGKITYDYVFVPQNIGQYEIPSLEFVYFDPQTGKYQTIRTNSQKIDVKKGKAAPDDVNKQLALLQSDIRTVHTSTEFTEASQPLSWGTTGYWILQSALIALFILALWGYYYYQNHFRHSRSQQLSKATREALRQLETAKAQSGSMPASAFYATLNQTLMNYLSTVLDINRAEMNLNSIKDVLTQKQMDQDQIQSITDILEKCQYAQYAPVEMNQKEELYTQTVAIIQMMESIK